MYVIRWNAKIKRGRMQDAIEFFKGGEPEAEGFIKRRLYANVFGDNDILAGEVEFDSIEAAARFVEWVEGDAQKEITEKGWYDISAGNVVELWKIID